MMTHDCSECTFLKMFLKLISVHIFTNHKTRRSTKCQKYLSKIRTLPYRFNKKPRIRGAC